MALLTFCGAELYVGVTGGAVTAEGSVFGTATITRDTAQKRSGAASYKFDSAAGNLTGYLLAPDANAIPAATIYHSVWVRLPANITTAAIILIADGSGLTAPAVRLNTDGTINLMVNSVAQGAASAQALDTTWRQLILKPTTGGSGFSAAELNLDGTVIGTSWTGDVAVVTDTTRARFGWLQAPGASKVINFDDYVMVDSSGANNNTYPAAEKVIYMPPLSDTQRGSWTGGAGGTTNLFAALDNRPPIGTATETDLTQVESIDGSGDNATDEYRGNCGSYTTAGVGAADTVRGLRALVDHGEDVSTGTKTGSYGFQTNPSATYGTFSFGNDVGALGTWPATWRDRGDVLVDTPTVTLASDLILGLRKTDTGTRVASCDALGAYVLYRPAPVGGGILPQSYPAQANPALYRM